MVKRLSEYIKESKVKDFVKSLDDKEIKELVILIAKKLGVKC